MHDERAAGLVTERQAALRQDQQRVSEALDQFQRRLLEKIVRREHGSLTFTVALNDGRVTRGGLEIIDGSKFK
jgi:hypothetical protein